MARRRLEGCAVTLRFTRLGGTSQQTFARAGTLPIREKRINQVGIRWPESQDA